MNLLLYAVEKHRQSTREVYIYVTLNLLRSTGISEQSEFYYILCIGKKIIVTPHIHILQDGTGVKNTFTTCAKTTCRLPIPLTPCLCVSMEMSRAAL